MVGIKTLRRLSCDLNRKINRFLRNLFKKNNDIDRNIVNFVDDSNHVFFGYYDVSPFHPDNDILLAMKVPYRRKINVAKTKATLGFFDMADLSFHDFGTSASWCWQQGCRMQWVRNLDSFAVLHNEIENQKYFSQIVDIRTGKILARKNKPIYSISQNCEWGLSLDFSRLER